MGLKLLDKIRKYLIYVRLMPPQGGIKETYALKLNKKQCKRLVGMLNKCIIIITIFFLRISEKKMTLESEMVAILVRFRIMVKILNFYIIILCSHLYHFFPVSIHYLQCIHCLLHYINCSFVNNVLSHPESFSFLLVSHLD